MDKAFQDKVVSLQEDGDFITLNHMEASLEAENNKKPSYEILNKIAFVKGALSHIIK